MPAYIIGGLKGVEVFIRKNTHRLVDGSTPSPMQTQILRLQRIDLIRLSPET